MSDLSEQQPAPSKHRAWVAVVFTLAVITGFLAVVSTWVKREALDTNNSRLSSLHDRGVLSDEEYQSEKALLLSH